MIRPKPLKKGDTIGIIGTCSPPKKERIDPAIKWIKSLGLEVVIGRSVNENHGYLCGEDKVRADDLNYMFHNKDIKGIFIVRGGYGAARILNMIDYDNIKKNPKILAGYSDVTALHIAINQKCKMITFHTPMPCTEFYTDIDDYTVESFKDSIFKINYTKKVVNPDKCKGFEGLVKGKACGRITGGNLSIIASLMGTPYEINTKNKILFLEDIDEAPYKIDRMLTQLRLANKFKDAAGIILGSWAGCDSKDTSRSLSLNEVFNEIIIPENRPTIMNVACGHTLPTMSIAIGSNISINADSLEILNIDTD